jgi:hypothetical protein
MSAERVVGGLAVGLVSSWVSGAIDAKGVRSGEVSPANVAFTTAAICTVCVYASEYLMMPYLVPIILAGAVRATHETREFYTRIVDKIYGPRS